MKEQPVINVVATKCQPEVEAKFDTWYKEIHIPNLFKFKGMKKADFYKILDETAQYPRYIAIYEFESQKAFEEYGKSPELTAARAEMQETWKDGGWETVWRVQYKSAKSWKR